MVAVIGIDGRADGATLDQCKLNSADLVANNSLSYDDFDQRGTTSTTWRQLSDHGCFSAASKAADAYAMNADQLTPKQLRNVLFHEGQSLAMGGDDAAAARLVSAARDPDQSSSPDFDSTTYLKGTRSFLLGDRIGLADAAGRLGSESGRGNQINARALAGLLRCFGQPYVKAYSAACRPSQEATGARSGK